MEFGEKKCGILMQKINRILQSTTDAKLIPILIVGGGLKFFHAYTKKNANVNEGWLIEAVRPP